VRIVCNIMTHGSACEKAEDKKDKMCHDPGPNRGPLDLQFNALPTELTDSMMRGTKENYNT
jgi:hypothetical protein